MGIISSCKGINQQKNQLSSRIMEFRVTFFIMDTLASLETASGLHEEVPTEISYIQACTQCSIVQIQSLEGVSQESHSLSTLNVSSPVKVLLLFSSHSSKSLSQDLRGGQQCKPY